MELIDRAGSPGNFLAGAGASQQLLSLEATTSEGPRHVDLSVIVAAPPDMLSFLVRSDEADILDRGIEQVSFRFGLESVPNGGTAGFTCGVPLRRPAAPGNGATELIGRILGVSVGEEAFDL